MIPHSVVFPQLLKNTAFAQVRKILPSFEYWFMVWFSAAESYLKLLNRAPTGIFFIHQILILI